MQIVPFAGSVAPASFYLAVDLTYPLIAIAIVLLSAFAALVLAARPTPSSTSEDTIPSYSEAA